MKTLLVIFYLAVPVLLCAQLSEKETGLLRLELSGQINRLRNQLGLKTLIFNDTLKKAAEFHSRYMVENNILTHEEKPQKYKTPTNRVHAFGGEIFQIIGENVLYSTPQKFPLSRKAMMELAEEMFTSWKNSSGHYANMVNTEYIYGDFGFEVSKNTNAVYATQVFGTKGHAVSNQLSKNAFNLKKAPEDCDKTYKQYNNILMNMGNCLSFQENEVVFSYHDAELLSKILSESNDGLAIDLISRSQLLCGQPNQLDFSPVYDGILLQPVYKNELFGGNRAEGDYRLITKVGTIPSSINAEDYSPSLIFIKDGKACNYTVPAIVYSENYELRPIEPIVKDISVQLVESGVKASQVIQYDFGVNKTTPANFPPVDQEGTVHSVDIHSYSSVEGDSLNNQRLHQSRASAILKHIQAKKTVPDSIVHIESEENWELMKFQFSYFDKDSLSSVPYDSIKQLIKLKAIELPWDSLLSEQRKAYAIIHFAGTFEESDESIGEFNLRTAVATNNEQLVNKALYVMYTTDNYYGEVLFERHIMDFFKKQPQTLANYLALLSSEFYQDPHKTVEFIHHWLSRSDELDIDAKTNLLHLYTLMGDYFLDNWDVASEHLANVVHPTKIEKFSSPEIRNELVLNLHLVFINYYGQINNSPGISTSFYFISDYFKPKTLSAEDDVDLALFFNKWSMYHLTIDYLTSKFKQDRINEDGVFILGTTMNRLQNKSNVYLDVHKKAVAINKNRWCKWLDNDFQIMRNTDIKQLYCESCNH